jgi:hypothetical protein
VNIYEEIMEVDQPTVTCARHLALAGKNSRPNAIITAGGPRDYALGGIANARSNDFR